MSQICTVTVLIWRISGDTETAGELSHGDLKSERARPLGVQEMGHVEKDGMAGGAQGVPCRGHAEGMAGMGVVTAAVGGDSRGAMEVREFCMNSV